MPSGEEEFDWDDFMRDTYELSVAATGAWLRCLFKMRSTVTRGRISWPISAYARLFGTSQDQAKVLIDEIRTLGIGDAETQGTDCIVLVNRRMYRGHREAELNRESQNRYRERVRNKGDTETVGKADVSNSPSYSFSSKRGKKKKEEEMKGPLRPEIFRVFTFWQIELNHPKAMMNTERWQVISDRLKDGYSVDDMETAILGCKNSEWHMGQNPDGKIQDDLELILRENKIEKFIGYTRTVEQNGTNQGSSQREKSSARTINAERMADAIARGDDAALSDILGRDGKDNRKGYLS